MTNYTLPQMLTVIANSGAGSSIITAMTNAFNAVWGGGKTPDGWSAPFTQSVSGGVLHDNVMGANYTDQFSIGADAVIPSSPTLTYQNMPTGLQTLINASGSSFGAESIADTIAGDIWTSGTYLAGAENIGAGGIDVLVAGPSLFVNYFVVPND